MVYRMSKHQHYWISTEIPHVLVFLNGKFRYDCSVCDKQKYFKFAPVNPVVPSAWAVYNDAVRKGNAHLVMAPPMSLNREPNYLEGERYAKLIEDTPPSPDCA